MTKTKRIETRTTIRIDADLAPAYKALAFGDMLDNDPELIDALTITYLVFAADKKDGFKFTDAYKRKSATVKAPKTLPLTGLVISLLLRAYLTLEELEPTGFDNVKTKQKAAEQYNTIRCTEGEVLSAMDNTKNSSNKKAAQRREKKTISASKTNQSSRQLTVNGSISKNKNYLVWFALNYLKTKYAGKKSDAFKRRTELLLEMNATRTEHPERLAELIELSKGYELNAENPAHTEALVNVNKNRAWTLDVLPEYTDRVGDRGATLLALYILIPELLEKAKTAHENK